MIQDIAFSMRPGMIQYLKLYCHFGKSGFGIEESLPSIDNYIVTNESTYLFIKLGNYLELFVTPQ